MRRSRCRFLALMTMTFAAAPLGAGCDDGKPYVDTSLNEAKVSGVVKVRGKPAEGGTILFNGSNSRRLVRHRAAPIGKDGTYSLTAYTGANQVSFDGELAKNAREVGLIKEFADVARGENTFDFDLLGEGGSKKLPFPDSKTAKALRKPGARRRR